MPRAIPAWLDRHPVFAGLLAATAAVELYGQGIEMWTQLASDLAAGNRVDPARPGPGPGPTTATREPSGRS
jgi:hypothetical protein